MGLWSTHIFKLNLLTGQRLILVYTLLSGQGRVVLQSQVEKFIKVRDRKILPALLAQHLNEGIFVTPIVVRPEHIVLKVLKHRLNGWRVLLCFLVILVIVYLCRGVGYDVSCHFFEDCGYEDKEAQGSFDVLIGDNHNIIVLWRNNSMENLSLLRVEATTLDTAIKEQSFQTYEDLILANIFRL